jgi:20S proteasome subunit alpha 3
MCIYIYIYIYIYIFRSLLTSYCLLNLCYLLRNHTHYYNDRYLYKYQEPIPIEVLVKQVCNYKQQYTQFGGLRPFGVAFLIAGWDRHYGYQVYQSDPSGNYSGWKGTVIGQNNQAGKSILKTDFKEDGQLVDNLRLSVKILLKTMDSTTPSPERIELSELRKLDDGTLVHVLLKDDEVKSLIEEVQKEQEQEAKSSGDI